MEEPDDVRDGVIDLRCCALHKRGVAGRQKRRIETTGHALNQGRDNDNKRRELQSMRHRKSGISRRNLLKEAVLGVSAAALSGPAASRDRVASAAAKDKLRLALVGCGGQGRGDMQGMLST